MKQIYKAPDIELMSISRDVITTSSQPWIDDIVWDFSKYTNATDPADYIDGVNG